MDVEVQEKQDMPLMGVMRPLESDDRHMIGEI
jgi:hypothetical protein